MHVSEAQSLLPSFANYLKVLIVDDDSGVVEFLQEAILMEIPSQVMSVSNAFAALQMVMNLRPDVLILDYQLPDMNGLVLYDRLKQSGALDGTNVIMISANLPLAEVAQRKITGMQKPFDLEPFLALLKRMQALERKGSNEEQFGTEILRYTQNDMKVEHSE